MRALFVSFSLLFFVSSFAGANDAKGPRVPSEVEVAGMKLKITEAARKDIQKDVDALHQSPKYFNVKLDRVKLYFPIIEKIFKEEGVPDDFKFLAVQESALISDAVSSANAVGFWQFKDFTGREVGLRIDKNVDERLNIVSSTYGVSKYFKRHNFYFKNWIYTILAHMTGRGGAMKHVDKQKFGAKKLTIDKNSHWYVKRFLAHFIAFRDELSGKHSQGLSLLPYEKGEGKNLEQIAKNFKVEIEEVKKYNKWLKRGKVPSEKTYTVLVPTKKKVKISPQKKDKEKIDVEPGEPVITKKTYPNIRKGLNTSKTIFIKINGIQSILAKKTDTSDSLATKGKIRLSKFLKYNDMTIESAIKEGEIYYLRPKRNRANIYFYTVNQKESMWDISQKFGLKVSKLAKLNRMLTIDEPEIGRVMWLREKRPKDTAIEIKEIISQPIDEIDEKPLPAFQEIPEPISELETSSEEQQAPAKELETSALEADNNNEPVTEKSINSKGKGKIHKTVVGETLYSISRLYNVSVAELTKWNNLNSTSLEIGQEINVGEQLEVSKTQEPNDDTDESKIHVVMSGETLYAVSRKYDISVETIMQLNDLNSSDLFLGQKLIVNSSVAIENLPNIPPVDEITIHVVEPGDTLYGISKKYDVSVDAILDMNNKDNINLEIGEKIRVK